MRRPALPRGRKTIRARVLAIALVPTVALMVVGIGLSGYFALQGIGTRTFADNVRGSLEPTTRFVAAVQEERRLTTLKATGMVRAVPELDTQRATVDEALRDMQAVAGELADTAPQELKGPLHDLTTAGAELPEFRRDVDRRNAGPQRIYDFYGELVELVGAGIQGIARSATDAEVGFEQMISYDLFRSVEAQSRSHALVIRGIQRGLDHEEFHELAHQMGSYHEIAETIYPRMTSGEQRRYDEMKAAAWWSTLVGGDNAVMALGPGKHPVDFDLAEWRDAASELSAGLLGLYNSHSRHAAELGTANGTRVLVTSLAAGGLVLLTSAGAVLFALARSRALIRRLTRLREDTLQLAEQQMPEVVRRVADGEKMQVESDMTWLDHGDDEIGQVADAFNKAQLQAVVATVREAETRAGVRAVFLNMAHRTQVMAHRQLQVLDQAERGQDDPQQLRLLFELDHLATQGRRNAESLIVLGGRTPGRQWRKPVSLREVIDGAVAETAQYARVNVGKMADVALRGAAVGDIIHLLAELLDNATAFSPPQTDVDVRSAVVGKGLVVEIEDQGLGVDPPERLAELNDMLQSCPDFSVMSLSEEIQIGLFVVAKLAERHGVRVTLRESVYGGIRAIVLIPTTALAEPDDQPPEPSPEPEAEPEAAFVTWRPRPRPSAADTVTIAVTPGADDGKPPLPRRNRLESLAPQLLADEEEPTLFEPADGPPPERFQASMQAFQRGTTQARSAAEDAP